MLPAHLSAIPTPAEARLWSAEQIIDLAKANATARGQLAAAQRQLDWFRRQLFGSKSEKRRPEAPSTQLSLGELPVPDAPLPVAGQAIRAHTQRRRATDFAQGNEPFGPLFFDPRVPVETIPVPNPEIAGLAPDQYEVIGERISHRLAQRPGSYVILKYVRPVIKLKAAGTLHCPLAPIGVLEGSRADVSFLAGLLPDKFAWHLPLYRQHQRLREAGLRVSRPWLTQLAAQAAGLLAPIYEAQLASIRASRVKAVDETPLKAGRAGPGKMKSGYFWPVHGRPRRALLPVLREPRPRERRGGAGPDPG